MPVGRSGLRASALGSDMSQTVSVDVVGRSYWAYIAARLVEGLDGHIAGTSSSRVIPDAVYSDAQEFLKLALEGGADTPPLGNPYACLSNYLIAAGAVRASADQTRNRSEVQAVLQSYKSCLEQLSTARISDIDIGLARNLRDFFAELQSEGESESYARVAAQFDMPHVAPRVRA